jgi:acyl-coenzyme A thioesterase 13
MTAAPPPDGFAPLDAPGPFSELVGPLYARAADGGTAVVGLRAEERHANPAGTVHGGLLATLCDVAVGQAVRSAADELSAAATVSLTTDYLAPASPGVWLEASVEVEKLGGRLAFADCSVTADGAEVVRARAVFSVLD